MKQYMKGQTEFLGSALEAVNTEWFDTDIAQQAGAQMSVTEMAEWLYELRELNNLADKIKKEIGAVYDHVRTIQLPERMDDEGLSSMRVQGVGMVKLTADMYISVKDQEKLFGWLEENGLEHLIQEKVNTQQLKSVLRKYMEDGEEVPSDYVKITPFSRASITK